MTSGLVLSRVSTDASGSCVADSYPEGRLYIPHLTMGRWHLSLTSDCMPEGRQPPAKEAMQNRSSKAQGALTRGLVSRESPRINPLAAYLKR